jgi:glycosyltransferase involved in cell wall biosynthesis
MKATIKLAEKQLNFKVIFIGKETDSLVNGKLELSQQSSTQEYKKYLEECAQVYQIHRDIITTYIEGLGYCDYEEVEKGYQTCSCVLMPSVYEGFGLAVSEALMWGIPVIASDLEVYKEQVELYESEERVQFYKPGDAEKLAFCMENFISNPIPRLSAEEVKEKMTLWTWDDVARKYVSLLEEADKNAG